MKMKLNEEINSKFEVIEIQNKRVLFSICRIDRSSIPSCLYIYDLRHDDESHGDIVELQDYIFVNHYGTIISSSPLSKGLITENDYNFTGEYETLRDYYPQIDM